MSVALNLWGVSDPCPKPWAITVLVVIVITWKVAADIVSAYANVVGLLSAHYAGVLYRNRTDGDDQPPTCPAQPQRPPRP